MKPENSLVFGVTRLILGILLLLNLSACSNTRLDVDSSYDQALDFSSFKRYAWHTPNQHNEKTKQYLDNPLVEQRIHKNIDRQLQLKGLQRVEPAQADILVNYSVVTQEKLDIDTYNTYSGFAPGWEYGPFIGSEPYRFGAAAYSYPISEGTTTTVNHHLQGTLVIDILRPDTDTLLWRGTAEGKLPEGQSSEKRNRIVDEAVTKILARFPPKPQ